MVPQVRDLVCVMGVFLLASTDLLAQVRVGPGVPPPTKIHHVEPIYPTGVLIGCAITQTACTQVIITVDITIGIDGSVVNAVVLSPNPPFQQAALTAVRQWRYQPVAAPVIMTETVTFTPPGSGNPGPAPPVPQPPQPPQNLQATYVGGILTLTWSPVAIGGAPTSYVIRAGYLPSLSNLADFDTGSLATTFSTFVPPGFPPPDTTGSSVNPGGQLFIKVHSRNAVGTSVQSNVVLVDTRSGGGGGVGCTSPPGTPGGLTMTVQGTTVSFSWIASATASGYLLEAGSQSGAANLAAVNLGAQTTFSAPAPPGTYFVRVRATNGCGQSPPSNEVVVVVGGGAPPPGPGGAPAGGQWRPCSEAVASIVSAAPVSVAFVNVSSQPRLLFWIDFAGNRQPYGVLQPGQSGVLTSFVTHSWLVTDAAGACLGSLVLSGGGRFAIQ
jgi:VHL beta domain/Gram-negative bacterial TonB protein C-terminal